MQNVIIPELVNLQYKGTKVLTSRQLCDAYDCKYQSIKGNFHQHKQEFIEGVDYFCIVGDELRNFKLQNQMDNVEFDFLDFLKVLPPSPPPVACVYVLKMENDTVKIGISNDVPLRLIGVQKSSGLKVIDTYHTNFAPKNFMLKIEKKCHKTFKEYRTHGEFFKVSFKDACAELDKYAVAIADTLHKADCAFLAEVDYYNKFGISQRKKNQKNLKFASNANKLYLWTESGAFKHSQLLKTPNAKKVFEVLSQAYFYGAVCNEEILNRVYAMELDDNTVKIGRSADIEKRAKRIEVISNCKVLRTYSTDFFTLEIAKQIEFACHNFFAEFLAHDKEYFKITFEDACTEIDKIAKKIQEVEESALPVPDAPPEISADIEMYCNFLDKIITLCNMTEDKNLRDDLIKAAFELISRKF